MIDVIVPISVDTPKQWVANCLDTVRFAISKAPLPVRLIQVRGVPGSIGLAYKAGYDAGGSEYVTWVDDDDWVLPNAFSCLRDALGAKPDAVFARELQYGANERVMPVERRHHMAIYRRDALSNFEWDSVEARAFTSDALRAHTKDMRSVDVKAYTYVHRIYMSKGMELRRKYAGERHAAD